MDNIIPPCTKLCTRCGIVKPSSEFSPGVDKKDGLASRCKQCRNERHRLTHPPKQVISPLETGVKKCTLCKEEQPLDAFNKHASGAYGYSSMCKKCCATTARANYQPRPRVKKEVVIPTSKQCKACLEVKPAEYFSFAGENRSRLQSWCRECVCAYNRQNMYSPERRKRAALLGYGITQEQYEAMLIEQDGVCAICKRPETAVSKKTGKPRGLAIDHSHETGTARQLLCQKCNQSLGFMDEDPELIKALLAYAEKWKGK